MFAELGCEVANDEPDLDGVDELFQTLRAAGYAAALARDLERGRAQLKDTVVWNIERGLALTPADLERAATIQTALDARVARFFSVYEFLVLPTVQVLPFPVEVEWPRAIEGVAMQTYVDWMATCYAISCLRAPAISVPCGFSPEGLPVGLTDRRPRGVAISTSCDSPTRSSRPRATRCGGRRSLFECRAMLEATSDDSPARYSRNRYRALAYAAVGRYVDAAAAMLAVQGELQVSPEVLELGNMSGLKNGWSPMLAERPVGGHRFRL